MKTIGNFFSRTLVGMGLTLGVASFFDGGLGFILISIICTAFISLVVWIPLWWIVGFVFLSIIGSFTKSSAKPEPKPPVNPDRYVLTRYLSQELARGKWSREQIDQRLRSNGWSDSAIQQAHRAVSTQRR